MLVEGGACADVYGVVNSRYSNVCTFDTLTIVAWDAGSGTIYDTCTQLVHILEPFLTPLLTLRSAGILVAALLLAGYAILRRVRRSA